MGVSKPSVSHAVKLLREDGFLVMDDDYTLHLTDLGREVAEKLYERHQYFTEQLTDAGVDADTAEAEACKMEHTISSVARSKKVSYQAIQWRKNNILKKLKVLLKEFIKQTPCRWGQIFLYKLEGDLSLYFFKEVMKTIKLKRNSLKAVRLLFLEN